jgi:hypothetical protein
LNSEPKLKQSFRSDQDNTVQMPFSFSRKGRSSKKPVQTQRTSETTRPFTEPRYTHPGTPPRPPPLLIPSRLDTATPASFTYDNGTGKLDPELVHSQGFPASVTTTDQLAAYMRSRRYDQARPSVEYSPSQYSSHYSQQWPSYSPVATPRPAAPTIHRAAMSLDLPRPHAVRAVSNPIMSGMQRRYIQQPVVRVLPGATRENQYEGFWLRRGP